MQSVKIGKAFTLLELLLALAVIAALLFAAVRYYTHVRENAKVSQAVQQIALVAEASYKWLEMQNQTNFCGGTDLKQCANPIQLEKLVQAGLLTENDIQSPWPTENYGLAMDVLSVNPRHVAIGYNILPKAACMSLLQKLKDKVVVVAGKPQIGCEPPVGPLGWHFWGGF